MLWKLCQNIISLILGIILRIRHYLYDHGLFKSSTSPIHAIVVGNLSIGGGGKTPFTDFLLDELKGHHTLGFVSRGYGRKTHGLVEINENSDATAVGDEPLLICKHHPDVKGVVAEKRIVGIRHLKNKNPQTNCIVLDDAYQHRALVGQTYILLSKFYNPFFQDKLWPAGGLRDIQSRALAADAIVITDAPLNITAVQKENMRNQIRRFSAAPVFFAHLEYLPLKPVFQMDPILPKKWGGFCAIAHPQKFLGYLKEKYDIKEQLAWRDHQWLGEKEARILQSKLATFGGQIDGWITTEKDAMRIAHLAPWKNLPLYYLPIKTKINEDDKEEWKKWLSQQL
ncbi:MAG: hypothetical protein RL609_332 [Bacteroidota bacterium]|jgi:tetraacyldisaccharide 4'-kinase